MDGWMDADGWTDGCLVMSCLDDYDEHGDDDDDDENDNEEKRSNDAEKLILSQDTYNTLTRSTNKKTVSFYNASGSMKRKMSSFETQSEESLIH